MFVEISDFDGHPWNLPNLEHKANTFMDFVEHKEREALVNLLGLGFYNTFKAALDAEDPEAEPPVVADQLWLDIRDGGSYTLDDVEYTYGGLKNLLIPYIYSEWIREESVTYTGLGVTVPNAENGNIVSPERHIIKGWNEYVRKLGYFHYNNPYYYDRYSYRYPVLSTENTLYGLLQSNEAYPEHTYVVPKPINSFNI